MELVDRPVLEIGGEICVGSSPTASTINKKTQYYLLDNIAYVRQKKGYDIINKKFACCIRCMKPISLKIHRGNHGYCETCVPKIDSFTISHRVEPHKGILEMKLIDLECKHIMSLDDTCRKIYEDSIKANFQNIQWGYFRENVSKDSENYTIEKMITDNFLKPIRITITHNRVWADNTHTTISYIRRFGDDTKVKDVPFYICDLRKVPITILGDKKISGSMKNVCRMLSEIL